MAHSQLRRWLPERDAYLFPVAALLIGWGLLTIWRLSTAQAVRQTAWLALIGMLFVLALRYDARIMGGRILSYLRRYKYIWLTSGMVLTAVTLILGTNPLGSGPRLWLGCCGVYFQPSEPLKLLLIIYLSAYLADRQVSGSTKTKLLPLLTPTIIMTGLSMLLLVFQRDLGTAALFMVLYAVIVYAGTGNQNVLFASLAVLLLAALGGYALFDVVNQRFEAWVNPWLDPSGHSYQIVQSLLAVANGGILGRGVGMGSPNLVPIAQSDFIFSAISEESGLVGAFGVLGLLALIVNRGMRIARRAPDTFQRLLAIGLVVHLVGQSILIIAGNLRLLPLTGVTLPFVSNGGSSLLVSFFELLCLLLISSRQEPSPILHMNALNYQNKISLLVSSGLMLGLAGAALVTGWWSLIRGTDLLNRTDNPRRSIADRYVLRGSILDHSGRPLAESAGPVGSIKRKYPYPALGPLVGYTDPVYGQSGLEASLDPYLRGLRGYPTLTISWENLLYGQPPPGLDVRLSLDLDLQTQADRLLTGHKGALVLMNASTGEVLAMATSPSFDANALETNWSTLINDPSAPLLNRAVMGMYPAGNSLGVFLLSTNPAKASDEYNSPDRSDCATAPAGSTLAEALAAGCTESVRQLISSMDPQEVLSQLDGLGFFSVPAFPVETLSTSKPGAISDAFSYIEGLEADSQSNAYLLVSPVQMALAAASLSYGGERLSPRLAMAVENPNSGWVMLPVNGQPIQAVPAQTAVNIAEALAVKDLPIWQVVAISGKQNQGDGNSSIFSWYIGGTIPEWNGASLALALLLEEANPQTAQTIGRSLLQYTMYP